MYDNSSKWVESGFDVGKALMDYRDKSVQLAEALRLLSDSQFLSLNFIFLFDRSAKMEYDLPEEVVCRLKKEMKENRVEISKCLLSWSFEVVKALDDCDYGSSSGSSDEDEDEDDEDDDDEDDDDEKEAKDKDRARPTKMEKLLHKLEAKAFKSQSKQQKMFISLVRLLCLKFPSWQGKPMTENTHIIQNISCFVDVFLLDDSSFIGVW
ncbi:hypothetical protein BD560DRAFT_57493 [Blakeslea trispora]|nr:hypothetical protein BD560DRAFT_57493 [Blakeslea trispora]